MVELRPYQVEAISQAQGRSGLLLAMVMGSGKTLTAIEIVRLLADDPRGIVFCPSTLKYQWKDSEIAKWWPEATVSVIDGNKERRFKQYEKAGRHNFTILSYEMLVHDWDLIRKYLPRDFIIADECTYIKGIVSKRSKRIKSLARQSKFNLGLSGQPVENKPEELFSIMEFVDPTVLGSFTKFDRTFIKRDYWGTPKSYKNLDVLGESLKDAMFRRSRDDIRQFLPERIETEVPVKPSTVVSKIDAYIRDDLLTVLDEAAGQGFSEFNVLSHYGKEDDSEFSALRGQIMARITAMKMLCSSPRLLVDSAERFAQSAEKLDLSNLSNLSNFVTGTGSEYAYSLLCIKHIKALFDTKESAGSSKIDQLMLRLNDVFDLNPQAKIVIFSAYKGMVSLIGERLIEQKTGFTSLTGDTTAINRQKNILRFNEDPKCRVFLSSDAGAYGVNLDKGTNLICYDLPWSAGTLGQRVARIDRTSTQHGSIFIEYMYVAGSIEERQLHMLREKQRVAEAFVDGKGFDAKGSLELSLSSLREFLTSGS